MSDATPISIRDTVGAALRFVRENVRFVFIVAALAALAQAIFLPLGPNVAWMAAVLIAVLVAHTALTRAALGGAASEPLQLSVARVGGAMLMVGLFLGIVFVMLMFTAMSFIIAPYQAELQAAGQNQEAVAAIVERALQEQQGRMTIAMVIGAVLFFLVTTRFYLAAPATIDRKRISVFESWRMTRGNFLRIAGARLFLLTPAFILASMLQALLATAVGAPTGDPVQMLNYAQANLLGFALFYTLSIFLQIVIYSVLEAALSAKIYRSLA
ncbi:MAG: hypothetical protein R3C31_04585 [Hyphomonadaceae bacterium]